MTSQESELAWHRIMCGTATAKFKGMSSSSANAIGVTTSKGHQNSCGHGFSWEDRIRCIARSTTFDGLNPHRLGGHGFGNSPLGQSPSEWAHRFKQYRN